MLLFYLSSTMFLLISIMSFLISLIMLSFKYSMFLEWNIFIINSLMINMFIYIDWMSMMFMFIVMIISSMIMLYCSEYMNHDNYNLRFFYLVFFFIMSMMLMIFSPNLVSILIGWDGLGLISYLLVIYYNNISSYNSGMLTVLMNRVGDVMILLSIGMMMMYGSWNFTNLNMINSLILLLIIIAAFTKSAQLPFSSWLPAAMAAPTPVSSLVHSSTLVTAGVYLLIRFNYLMNNNEMLLEYIKITGLLTMLFASLSAMMEYDLKKIIAFSTLSQLGLMMMIYGMKQYNLVFFHLIIHAIFKSMMFMCSGSIIHVMNNCQDIRMMGNITKSMPLTSMIMMIAGLALCGLPFMSGFYSKDKILEFIILNNYSIVIKFLMYLSIMLTIMYNFRMLFYLTKKTNMFYPMKSWLESSIMTSSMLILMILTLMFGFLMKWILFNNIENMFMNFWDKLFFYMLCILSYLITKINFNIKINFNNFIKIFLSKMWFTNNLISMMINYPLKFNNLFYYNYEKGWSEYIFKNTIYKLSKLSLYMISLNKNLIQLITMSMIFIILILLN
nr:NADH dehydrogenase subunit 5 [Kradibia gibbosae]